ncbi:ficolin-1-like [Chelonia mydas]|uniref:ficolin-1-like n=1 Tax=Chelonia mydas TaxID=8469 RepID=UPI001CA97514|nr:ficolin-1-like [Chelonia mydas]
MVQWIFSVTGSHTRKVLATSRWNSGNIHLLTSHGSNELHVDLMDSETEKYFAKYKSFQILGESENYKLILGDFLNGTAERRQKGKLNSGMGGNVAPGSSITVNSIIKCPALQ